MENLPLFKTFCTINHHYVYDTNRNQIVPISYQSYDCLSKAESDCTSLKDLTANSEEIRLLLEKGYLSTSRPQEIEHPFTDFFEVLLSRRIQKVTLQLTQNCNFRCSYCHYTNNDGGQRSHSNKQMSIDLAKRSILFLRDHSMDTPEVTIGFYGGEPLLEFPMIKELVDYADEQLSGKAIHYTITSNSVLMDDNVIRFFIEHDISLVISLDGPKEINDKHRVFAASGQGTFEAIIKKLEYLYKNYRKFFEQTTVNMVMDPSNDFDQINNLFHDYPFLNKVHISASTIDDIGSEQKNTFDEQFTSKQSYHDFLSYLYVLNRFPSKLISPIFSARPSSIQKDIESISERDRLPDKAAPGGPCVPGEVRLMVTVDGDFIICERVSEISSPMMIGNIDTGIQLDKAFALLNVAQITAETCKNCWAFSICSLCAKHADINGELSAAERLKYCQMSKRSALHMLRRKALILEMTEEYHQSAII